MARSISVYGPRIEKEDLKIIVDLDIIIAIPWHTQNTDNYYRAYLYK